MVSIGRLYKFRTSCPLEDDFLAGADEEGFAFTDYRFNGQYKVRDQEAQESIALSDV